MPSAPAWWLTFTVMGLGCALAASVLRTWFSERAWATAFLSPASWEALTAWMTSRPFAGGDQAEWPYLPVLGVCVAVTVMAWLGGAVVTKGLGLRTKGQKENSSSSPSLSPQPSALSLASALRRWGFQGWLWWCGFGLWEWLWIAAAGSGWDSAAILLAASIPFWTAACLAGWLTTGLVESLGLRVEGQRKEAEGLGPRAKGQKAGSHSTLALDPQPSTLNSLWFLVAAYVAVFVTMNWRLWFNLYIPHGDSAMYEEHLWNVLHGKGFRSYLDQGLFLGEHIQVVHLGLLPLYVFWPSHLLLELCESVALALGVFPVAWMVRRRVGVEGLGSRVEGPTEFQSTSPTLNSQPSTLNPTSAALCAAAAYLLYFPMQFLDIEIDLKTFRPEAFGIPILLLTLDQLDRRHWRGFLIGVLGCLTVKEDYALVLGPLGVWIALSREARGERRDAKKNLSVLTISGSRLSTLDSRLFLGIGLAAFSVLYLWLATRVVMPWFRTGEEIHYARYFSRLGDTPEAIVRTVFTRPGFVAGELLNVHTWLYALSLLLPVAGIALLSPGRLAVGLPLFGLLCLNELARDPRHQFHAPLVAIVFWATAAGLGRVDRLGLRVEGQRRGLRSFLTLNLQPSTLNHALWIAALTTGLFFSLSPLGLAFWDPGSSWNWWKLYGPTRRGSEFAKVAPQIPVAARVASTDFIHPRFTHYDRSYDYSGYVRKVSGYERRVPDDTDYIVIDATHGYSQYHRPEDVPEFHQSDRWELVPDVTDGYFIILKRRALQVESLGLRVEGQKNPDPFSLTLNPQP